MSFTQVGFGAKIGDDYTYMEPLQRLLFKEIIRFDASIPADGSNEHVSRTETIELGELPSDWYDNADDVLYSKVIFVPYEDYGRTTGPLTVVTNEELEATVLETPAVFASGIHLCSMGDNKFFLGWGVINPSKGELPTPISRKQMNALYDLTERLEQEGRWKGRIGPIWN